MSELDVVLADLAAESAELDELVSGLDEAGWRRPTPAQGWTIAHQIGHLRWTDEVAVVAAEDPAALAELAGQAAADPDGMVDAAAGSLAALPPAELLAGWRRGRQAMAEALRAVPAGTRLSWFGPPMSPTSMATARLMETWAHGLDVADTLGVERPAMPRLRHIARLAVRTRDFAFLVRGKAVPTEEFRVELVAPDGDRWCFGPDDARQRVTGSALELCLLATQRRNRADLALVADGPDADAWLEIAQAFAGLPGPGRPAAS